MRHGAARYRGFSVRGGSSSRRTWCSRSYSVRRCVCFSCRGTTGGWQAGCCSLDRAQPNRVGVCRRSRRRFGSMKGGVGGCSSIRSSSRGGCKRRGGGFGSFTSRGRRCPNVFSSTCLVPLGSSLLSSLLPPYFTLHHRLGPEGGEAVLVSELDLQQHPFPLLLLPGQTLLL